MLLNRVWMIGKNSPALAASSCTTGVCVMLSRLVLWCRHLLDGGDDQALVGAGRATTATGRIAAAADEGLIRLEKAAQRTGQILAQPVAQLVRHGPGRLICHPQFALQKFGRDAALVATHN